ncbi:hypothetical protein F5Y16DRAFT_125345 [Xylariaceae sp. FL0255]|nr:hypothetical protein F5Y16DRAFT_125345 [Xylariaceae sp. FL0255]
MWDICWLLLFDTGIHLSLVLSYTYRICLSFVSRIDEYSRHCSDCYQDTPSHAEDTDPVSDTRNISTLSDDAGFLPLLTSARHV